jgi:hypothetical protein
MVSQEIIINEPGCLDFYSRRETTIHTLGENSEKCLIDLDLRPSRRGTEKIFSQFCCLHCAYTEIDWKGEAL